MAIEDLSQLPIGIFDSGIGGLTVMHMVMKKSAGESIIYFGDTARLPYGSKASATIVRYSIENTIFLLEKGIKMLVIACNTASAYSADKLRRYFNIPIVDVVEAGVKQVVKTTQHGRLGILGTKGTITSGIYQSKISKALPRASIYAVACPLFAPLVEEGLIDHAVTRQLIKEYVLPLKEQRVDTVLLGCTHYPLLAHLIALELGPDVKLIDSAAACADMVEAMLIAKEMKAKEIKEAVDYKFYVSDDPERFGKMAQNFLGKAIPHVEKLSWHA